MVWYVTPIPKLQEGIKNLDAELKRGSDRSVAILAGSIVESYLKWFLERNTVQYGDMWKRLSHHSGPIGSFSVKADVAYMFHLISRDAHGDLIRIKDIRNMAAHNLADFDFSEQSVRDKCMALKTVDRYVKKTRSRGSLEYSDTGGGPKFWVGSRNVLSEIQSPRTRYIWAARVFTVALGAGDGHGSHII
jgi:DNA-binding MltR family transcriptional regulator